MRDQNDRIISRFNANEHSLLNELSPGHNPCKLKHRLEDDAPLGSMRNPDSRRVQCLKQACTEWRWLVVVQAEKRQCGNPHTGSRLTIGVKQPPAVPSIHTRAIQYSLSRL